jgi:hypothetical protein
MRGKLWRFMLRQEQDADPCGMTAPSKTVALDEKFFGCNAFWFVIPQGSASAL